MLRVLAKDRLWTVVSQPTGIGGEGCSLRKQPLHTPCDLHLQHRYVQHSLSAVHAPAPSVCTSALLCAAAVGGVTDSRLSGGGCKGAQTAPTFFAHQTQKPCRSRCSGSSSRQYLTSSPLICSAAST